MTLDERAQEIIDLLQAGFNPGSPLTPEKNLGELRLDSLELIEFLLLLEEWWPEAKLEDYEPTAKTSIRDIATEVERRLAT